MPDTISRVALIMLKTGRTSAREAKRRLRAYRNEMSTSTATHAKKLSERSTTKQWIDFRIEGGRRLEGIGAHQRREKRRAARDGRRSAHR